jgi:hypothetical protein
MHKIDGTTPSKSFLKAISNADITRSVASIITQLRLAHVPLNSYLKRFKRTDSARCPACGADDETISHYLLYCPSYAYERWTLARKAKKKRKAMTLGTLLGDPSLIAPLAKFIDATHRFEKRGEQTIG